MYVVCVASSHTVPFRWRMNATQFVVSSIKRSYILRREYHKTFWYVNDFLGKTPS